MATTRLASIVINAEDLERVVTFWSDFLGVGERQRLPGMVFLERQPGTGVTIAVQHVEEANPGRNRLHLDFGTDDAAGEAQRVLDLGGSELESHEFGDFGWTVFADPEGNEFCMAEADPDQLT